MAEPNPADLAFRVLRLEQQLESYQRLHSEELEQIRAALAALKAEVLAAAPDHGALPAGEEQDQAW
ncbi:MAG TPA: hypothetical protein VGA61_06180 [Anaerolineae bacterium]